MKFEFLPNEILIECFEYLNAFDIFHSFDQLNNRFNNLIRHVPLCVNFKILTNQYLMNFVQKMIRNPEIKNQIYSLNLPNEDEYLQFKTFLSVFHNEEFPNLQKIQSIVPLPTDESFITMSYDPKPDITIKLPYLIIFKFEFTIRNVPQEQNDNIIVKFRQFQTDFWQEQHRWCIEFIVGEKSASIYTIPYLSHKFGLLSNDKRYCSNNTFINVTNLTLDQE